MIPFHLVCLIPSRWRYNTGILLQFQLSPIEVPCSQCYFLLNLENKKNENIIFTKTLQRLAFQLISFSKDKDFMRIIIRPKINI